MPLRKISKYFFSQQQQITLILGKGFHITKENCYAMHHSSNNAAVFDNNAIIKFD
jgi:hypothetical protein